MTAKQKNSKKQNRRDRLRKKSKREASSQVQETRASESLAVCWGVTVTMLFFCNLLYLAVHFYASSRPDAQQMAVLSELLLLFGAIVGGFSLLLLPVLYRIRRIPPPRRIAIFGACLAMAPILVILVKTLQ